MTGIGFKAVWDALLWSAGRVETVFDYCQKLSKYVNDYMVCNQITDSMLEARHGAGDLLAQRINVSTNFGVGSRDEGQNRDPKTFYFDEGSTLCYWKTVGMDNHSQFEVMNFGSTLALLSSLTGAPGDSSLEGGGIFDGGYVFQNGTQEFSRPVTTNASFKQGNELVSKSYVDNSISAAAGACLKSAGPDTGSGEYTFTGTVAMNRGQVNSGPVGWSDIVNLGYLAGMGLGDPRFVSSPFRALPGTGGIFTTKIMARWPFPQNGASGEGAIPPPLAYCLYLVIDGRPVPVSQPQLPHWAYIDEEGGLSLGINVGHASIFVPWSEDETLTDIADCTLYLVIDRWGHPGAEEG